MAPTIELQPRDIELLATLFHCRIMSLAHAIELIFDGKAEMGTKRVQKLKAARLVRERPRKRFEPSVLGLTSEGIAVLRKTGRLLEYSGRQFDISKRLQVSPVTVAHELSVMDVRVAFFRAINAYPQMKIEEFGTWPSLFEFEAESHNARGWTRRQIVRPDGFCRIQESAADGLSEHCFFLELDRSTETQERIASRCVAYQNFYRSGGFAEWFGANPEDFKDFPFRVLVVLQNAERRNNLMHFCHQQKVPIQQLVWTSTLEEVLKNPLDRIWLCPIDYAKAVGGTRFDPDRLHPAFFKRYRRQIEREQLVDARAQKRSLF
jgi:hypothetical protein